MIPARSREGIKFTGGHKALPYDERGWGRVQEADFHPHGRASGAWGIPAKAGIQHRKTGFRVKPGMTITVLEDGYDIRTVQELLGRRDVSTTMIYTHALHRGG